MTYHRKFRALGAFALGAGLLASTGCAETALVGQLDDSELQDPEVYPLAALGMERENNDLIYANLDMYLYGGLTDQPAYGGVSGFESRTAIGDTRNRSDRNPEFEQTHEAIWTAYKMVSLGRNLFRGDDNPDFFNNPIVAKSWLNAGFMERVMADHFCEATFQYGPFGGFNLGPLQEWQEDQGNVEENAFDGGIPISKDSMFTRMIYDMEQAIEWADRAIAAGVPLPEEDPAYFDPEVTRIAAYGGLAQAHQALASLGVNPSENWAAAVAAAANVPTDFVHLWNTEEDLRSNQVWSLSWANDDLSFWADTIEGTVWGSAYGRHIEPQDLRGDIEVCQDFGVKTGGEAVIFTRSNVLNTGNQDCSSPFRSINADMELTSLPRWLPNSYEERYTEIPVIEGTDVRLIEAEAALVDGDLETFTDKINEVRNFYNASEITQPATAGALEYPNALDDGWSLLDREVLLNEFGELRRMFHLYRWNHPFVADNHTTHPVWRDLLAEQSAGFQRGACFPIPSNECNLNAALDCPDLG